MSTNSLPSLQPIRAADATPAPAPLTRKQAREARDAAATPRATKSARPRRTRSTRVMTFIIWACVALIAVALAVVGVALLAPQTAEYAYGQIKTVPDTVQKLVVPDAIPTIRLGEMGGHDVLNRCDGTFTGMSSYGTEIPTVYAAHNNCSGDVILPWELGQRVNVVDHTGTTRLYTVVDIRNVPKTWGTVDDLVGIKGDFALQTCFYGQDLMKFVGLAPSP